MTPAHGARGAASTTSSRTGIRERWASSAAATSGAAAPVGGRGRTLHDLRQLRATRRRGGPERRSTPASTTSRAQVDELRAELERHDAGAARRRHRDARRGPDADAPLPEAPPSRGRTSTTRRTRRSSRRSLDDAALTARLPRRRRAPGRLRARLRRARRRVPVGREPSRSGGALLDAGSTLNHLHVLARVRPRRRLAAHRHARARGARRSPSSASPTCTPTCARCRSTTATYDRVACRSRRSSTSAWTTPTTAAEGESRPTRRRECAARGARAARACSRPAASCYLTVPGRPRRALRMGALAHGRGARRARRGAVGGAPRRRRRSSVTTRGLARATAGRGRRRALPRPLHRARPVGDDRWSPPRPWRACGSSSPASGCENPSRCARSA